MLDDLMLFTAMTRYQAMELLDRCVNEALTGVYVGPPMLDGRVPQEVNTAAMDAIDVLTDAISSSISDLLPGVFQVSVLGVTQEDDSAIISIPQ